MKKNQFERDMKGAMSVVKQEAKDTVHIMKQVYKSERKDRVRELKALKSADSVFKAPSVFVKLRRYILAGLLATPIAPMAACVVNNYYGEDTKVAKSVETPEIEAEEVTEDWMAAESKEEADAIYKEVISFFELNIDGILPDAPEFGQVEEFSFEYRGVTFDGRMIIMEEDGGHAMYIEITEPNGFRATKRYYVPDKEEDVEVNQFRL